MTPAVLTIYVPEQSNVFVNEEAVQPGKTTVRYQSPALKTGEAKTYSVRAEFGNGEAKTSETKTITVQAGDEKSLVFEKKAAPAPPLDFENIGPPTPTPTTKASDPPEATTPETTTASLRILVPDNAELFLNGITFGTSGKEHTLQIPFSSTDQPHTLTLSIKVNREGKLETQERQVAVAPRKKILVDFLKPASGVAAK